MIKKPSAYPIQWGHPLARGMVLGLTFHEGNYLAAKLWDNTNFNRTGSWSANPPSGAWVGGPNGAALDFGSTGRYKYTAPKYPWFGNPTPCSVVCGVKFNNNTANGAVVAYGNSGPGMMLQRFNGLMFWEVNGVTNRVANVGGFTQGVWMHVAGTYDGNILRLYKNAVQQAQSTRGSIQITQGNNSFYVSDNTLGTAQNIVLDYLYVYNRSLTPAEISMIMVDPFQMFRQKNTYLDFSQVIVGALNVTEANDTISAAGTVLVEGSLVKTEADDTILAQGGQIAIGTLDVIEENDSITASGFQGVAIGSLIKVEADDTILARGHSNQPPPPPQRILGLEWQTWDRAFEPKRSYI